MGLDAVVECNCYRLGKTKPFPVPELEHLFGVGEDGFLGLKVSYDDAHEALHDRISTWKYDACEHEDMLYASEQVANWSGYRAFQEALEQIGWEYFPTLEDELPTHNSGSMSPEAAAKVLEELAYFRTAAPQTTNAYLIDTVTGERLYEHIEAYNGLFVFAKPICMGVDFDGFFLMERDGDSLTSGKVVFRSQRFEQRVLERDEDDEPVKVEFFDADTEARYISTVTLSILHESDGNFDQQHPQLFHVEIQPKGAEAFDYIVQPLTRLCQAAIETGNPVLWC